MTRLPPSAMAPIPPSAVAPTHRAAYSDRTCALMAALCELAYEPPELRAARLGGSGFRLAGQGERFFLAIAAELAVLAFRGSADLSDWEINLDAVRVPMPGRPGVEVHAGFLARYQEVGAAAQAAVLTRVGPKLPLYVTGHSAGGALAQLAAAALDPDRLAACYTFGSPRVATASFDSVIAKVPHYRVVNDWDLVPGVPAPWWRGYEHVGDPRLLEPAYDVVLRRDRGPLARLLVDLWALGAGIGRNRFACVSDHMIWRYRERLDAIAAAANLRELAACRPAH